MLKNVTCKCYSYLQMLHLVLHKVQNDLFTTAAAVGKGHSPAAIYHRCHVRRAGRPCWLFQIFSALRLLIWPWRLPNKHSLISHTGQTPWSVLTVGKSQIGVSSKYHIDLLCSVLEVEVQLACPLVYSVEL